MRRSRTPRGTLVNVIEQYRSSSKFRDGLARSTQLSYEYAFQAAEKVLGEIPADEMRPSRMQRFIDKFADRPATQRYVLAAFKALERWAIVRDLLPHAITTGVEAPGGDGAREPWLDEHVRLAEFHARPDLARLVTLAANTGQRAGDLVRMRWQDIESYQGTTGINVIQQKTDVRLWVPFTPALLAAVETWERRPGYLVTKADGSPYTRPQLSDAWFNERRNNEALAPLLKLQLSFHGLRATAVIRWRRMGCTPLEIQSLVGMSRQMVERYSRRAEQRDNALAALTRLHGSEQDRNNVVRLVPGKGL